jgi:hypothetical protein
MRLARFAAVATYGVPDRPDRASGVLRVAQSVPVTRRAGGVVSDRQLDRVAPRRPAARPHHEDRSRSPVQRDRRPGCFSDRGCSSPLPRDADERPARAWPTIQEASSGSCGRVHARNWHAFT